MAVNSPNSPRQKMINLMYLVFIAMLAINISAEVLDGFELVRESLTRSTDSATTRNKIIFGQLVQYREDSPDKAKEAFALAEDVRNKSDFLFNFIEDKKLEIVKKTDKTGNLIVLKQPDDLNATEDIMLASGKGETAGAQLRSKLEDYRDFIIGILEGDERQQGIVADNLSTTPSSNAIKNNQSWEESLFRRMPLTASITILTKLQNDIRNAEGEALSTILRKIDVSDFRVNDIRAFVIPQSKTVVRGTPFTARAVLAAVDTTQRPDIFVEGIGVLPKDADGVFQKATGATGTFQVKGYIDMIRGGVSHKMPFSEEFFVVDPSATIFPTLMNVLYANYENPIEIAVPGVPSQNVTATMTNGRLERKGNLWVAYPSKAGTDAIITVSANIGGRSQVMANRPYRVRPLPDPKPFIEYTDENGNPKKFTQGKLAKSILLDTEVLKAAIDDDLLRVNFTVVRFEALFFDSFGNVLPVSSDGARFSAAQNEKIRGLAKGKTFFIRNVVARGPGGDERTLSPIEVIVN
ncbi:MAG: gliding motility protein GldM [Dysgonamonadaceae bacterium]|jgi:gliding motility-associated protein GldM|nr:gliding motility protein GldM [Dysgonamonadaceae bacterium]